MNEPLSHRILVLNRLWQAVNICGIKRGFNLLMQDHAQVIYAGDGSFRVLNAEQWVQLNLEEPPRENEACVQTVRMRMRIPKVLLLRYFDKMPLKDVKFNRENIYRRDSYRCQYCGETFSPEQLNIDHVIPREQGGQTSWENIVTSCITCNSRKANRMPHQANMKVLKRPQRPNMRPFDASDISGSGDPEWDYFLHRSS